MILDNIITIRTNPSNYRHYINKGYKINKCGEIITIKVSDLPSSSHIKINCKCDSCGKEKLVQYHNYNLFIKNHNIYTCYKCCNIKSRLTSEEKYGVLSYNITDECKNRVVNTIIEKYGSYELYKEYLRNKLKEDSITKYGVENRYQSSEIKTKSKQTMINNYGVEHALQNSELFNKSQTSGFKINKYNGIKYQGTYELDFLKICEENNIEVKKYKPINYKHELKNKRYYPDFYIPKYNLICEIKSSYYYEKEKEKNLLKEEYSKKSGLNFIFILDKNYTDLLNLISSPI